MMTFKYCRICKADTPFAHDKCNICANKENIKNRVELEGMEILDRVRRLEKIVEKNFLGT